MNYYNPYFYNIPNMANTSTPGLFRSLLGGSKAINWSSLLSNAQKTIGIINQTIPMVKQVTPAIHNAKTMFKVMNEFKKQEPVSSVNNTPTNQPLQKKDENKKDSIEKISTSSSDGPQFFI